MARTPLSGPLGTSLIRILFQLHIRRLGRNRQGGQAMVEFAMIAPVLFFLLFGVFEFGLMMFSLGSARYASADAGRVVSEIGQLTKQCQNVPGCGNLASPGTPTADCDADCQALSAINLGPLGTTSIATVDEIDVAKLQVNANGSLSCQGSTTLQPPCANNVNKYQLNGTAIGVKSYPSGTRDVTQGEADNAAVTVKFRYLWKSGIFRQFAVPNLQATYFIKLEPQRFINGG